jgi:pyrroline-5-carboxylate reductase
MKILIVGSGNMGKTYARSFLSSRFITEKDLFILDKNREQAEPLTEVSSGNVYDRPGAFISETDIIILAVKPQDFYSLSDQIKPFIGLKRWLKPCNFIASLSESEKS